MNWSKEWSKGLSDPEKLYQWPKIEIIPPIDPVNQHWSSGALIFKEMTKAEFKEKYPSDQYGKLNIEKVYNNKVPTHDPYTNPDAHIYYQCNCGAIFDPGTKSFAALNNYASETGWKVRWKKDGQGYEPFCVDCGKDVE